MSDPAGGAIRVLCTGDLHLGRRPSHLPTGSRGERTSGQAVWEATVRHAVEQGVDLVTLTGDVVDRANRYYEAIGPLEAGVGRLARAGVPTVAVAGNHDHDVLPRLARSLPEEAFHLLGRGGTWERLRLELGGHDLLCEGWSFPRRHVRESPLATYDLAPPPVDAPRIGLLHADLDQPDSPYGPVTTDELARTGHGAWLLGHVHAPRVIDLPDGRPVLYPGSPQPLDPSERGLHGPRIVRVGPGGGVEVAPEPLPLATVRYEELTLDLAGAATREEVDERIPGDLRAEAGPLAAEGDPACLVLRLVLTGRTPVRARTLEEVGAEITEQLDLTLGETRVVVDRVEVATRPELDLAELARGQDPPAFLARILRDLASGEPSPETAGLLREARQATDEVHEARAFGPVSTDPTPGPDEVRRRVRREAYHLLETLLDQKGGGA